MPFATSFYLDRRLMITRGWGHITWAEVRAYQQELGQRPEFDPTWAHVVDARDAFQLDLSKADIRDLATTSVLAPSARRAMVATDRATFGVFRMYGTLFELQVDGSAVGVFTTLEDAIEWSRPDTVRVESSNFLPYVGRRGCFPRAGTLSSRDPRPTVDPRNGSRSRGLGLARLSFRSLAGLIYQA